jgi:NAD(P)-dependent dehydrogenase (short-subunit alcohol dehydrogenase family)
MEIMDKVAVVTGGASGIGAAMAQRFAQEGARGVVVADINLERAQGVAAAIGPQALALACDVSRESDIQELARRARGQFGRIDIYFSNAGILGRMGGIELEDALWDKMWQVHGMAHVWAARAVVPDMVARGEGYFVVTASAAGLLNIVESAPYGVTKHAAVAFAEWLSITYGDRGVKVSALCPQGVDTPMLRDGLKAGHIGAKVTAAGGAVLSAEHVAESVVAGLDAEKFLILPHPEVAKYYLHRATDTDRWLAGMRTLRDSLS